MPRVLVVGGGLAGCWAALTAAGAGAEVTLVRRALGATAVSSGAIDCVPPAEAFDAAAWLDRLERDHPDHPYLSAGTVPEVGDLEEELAALARTLEGAGLPMRLDLRAPALLAATTGQVRGAGMAQQTIAAGDLLGPDAVVVAGIRGLHRVDARAVAAGIADRVPGRRISAVTVRLPVGDGVDPADLDEPAVARAVEAPGGAEHLGQAVRASIEAAAEPADLVLVPPVLGLDNAWEVHRRFLTALGRPAGELLAPPPSAPGWRLQRALDRALELAAITVVPGTVTGVQRVADRVEAAVAGDAEVRCDSIVLAGGRFLGGGLSLEALPREPLLGLPVFVEGRDVSELARADVVVRSRFRSQPVLGAGLRVDAGCRPVDRFGVAPWANVVACGSLLAGVDTSLSWGGLGVVAWSAGRAGRAAAALAGVAAAA
jgi:glycerol-3-phosphate dehydrogenase subunit B